MKYLCRLRLGQMIGLILLAGVCAGCGLQQGSEISTSRVGKFPLHEVGADDKNASYDAKSHTLAAAAAGFTVRFPSQPSVTPNKYVIQEGNRKKFFNSNHSYRYVLPGENIDLMATERNEFSRTNNPEELRVKINRCCTRILSEHNFIESSRHPIRTADNALEGVEVEGKLQSGSDMFRMHVFSDNNNHIYTLIAAGQQDKLHAIDANDFFDSFSLSNAIANQSGESNTQAQGNGTPVLTKSPDHGNGQPFNLAALGSRQRVLHDQNGRRYQQMGEGPVVSGPDGKRYLNQGGFLTPADANMDIGVHTHAGMHGWHMGHRY